jgi:hypothetical protein
VTVAASCKGCGVSVRLPEREIARILAAYLAEHPQPTVGDGEYARRLERCRACADLIADTTCRHCGCLVAVRARLAGQDCPAPEGERWENGRRNTEDGRK